MLGCKICGVNWNCGVVNVVVGVNCCWMLCCGLKNDFVGLNDGINCWICCCGVNDGVWKRANSNCG